MNYSAAEGVAKALLYEGYRLHPQRPSGVKTTKRWTFGSLYPKAYAEHGRERSSVSTEVLVTGNTPVVGVRAAFLVACERKLGDARRVEAVERRIDFGPATAVELGATRSRRFELPAETWFMADVRFETRALQGVLKVGVEHIAPSVAKLRVRLENVTVVSDALSSDDAELVAFGSAHLVFGVEGGAFASLVDPPVALAEPARLCENEGVWPALVGDRERCDLMLASPIVVYDFPALANGSRGDHFGTREIDEMLALRLHTLRDTEKREPCTVDVEPRPGDRVRLRPHGGRDAIDVLLKGELATIVSLEHDFDGRTYCTVAIDADPGRDLAFKGHPGHRFFYELDELELLR